MAKCAKCGRKGFFLRVDQNGLCQNCAAIAEFERNRDELQSEIHRLEETLSDRQSAFEALKQEAEDAAAKELHDILTELEEKKDAVERSLSQSKAELDATESENAKTQKILLAAQRKLERVRATVKSAQYAVDEFEEGHNIPDGLVDEIDAELSPTVQMDLQCFSIRDLRKKFNENQKNIKSTYEKYKSRYTTKTNMAIYQLMTIALEAELQNVLAGLGYGKLEKAESDIQKITRKYYTIATNGNQSIAPTMKKYVGEMEYFFLEAVRIEYAYYVKRERAKEEQRAIREQMRQEAAERKELERQQKQMEKEESKYKGQIETVQAMLASETDSARVAALQERIAKLQAQLDAAAQQKEEIIKRQNGKAGNVYIISNIGSFGENVFKIGMTRRLDPQERIDELGNASVPFPFDVHSFIFSDDAVSLETNLHHILNDRRVNKVNLRKEFFNVTLDELEQLVYQLEPTAEFKRTILATQFRQSQSIHVVEEELEDSLPDDDE